MFTRKLITPVLTDAKILTSKRNYKVAVVGAASAIGQPLSLLLKMNSLVSHLALYDVTPVTCGVALEVSHINTPCKVTGHKGPHQLGDAIECASVVVIPAGVPRKPGMKRKDLFKTNACMVRDTAKIIARKAPKAIVAIVTYPVNSTVPIAAEVLKREKAYDPKRIMGVTSLDIIRSCTFVGEAKSLDPKLLSVPVVGGHSGKTIIPLFSQCNPQVALTCIAEIKSLTQKVQGAGAAVVEAKKGDGSASLSNAFAAARFTTSILRALSGEQNIVEYAYVASGLCDPTHLACPVLLGKCGVERNLGIYCLSRYEAELLSSALPLLKKHIRTGEEFVLNSYLKL